MREKVYLVDGDFFFFKQKTAYEITRRDWSSDVCSSDLKSCRGGLPISRRILFGCGHGRRTRRDVPCEVFAFDRDRVNTAWAVLGSLRPQVNSQVSGDVPVRFLITITRSVDRLIA